MEGGGRGCIDLLTHGGIFDGLVIVLPLTEGVRGWFVLVRSFFPPRLGGAGRWAVREGEGILHIIHAKMIYCFCVKC